MPYPIRLLNRPLALLPSYLGAIPSSGIEKVNPEAKENALLNDVAVIPVIGVLMNAPSWAMCGTTYSELIASVIAALDDDDVSAIVMHIDSPGGEVAGCAEVADLIFANRDKKPFVAILDTQACSAAYWIASACPLITVPQHGYSGNVGALQIHFDITGALDADGIVVTTVQYGAYKSEGYPTTPMTKGALARAQSDINAIGEAFVGAVARNRGLSVNAVRKTEARPMLGQAGVDVGFVDAVLPPVQAFAELASLVGHQPNPRRVASRPPGPFARLIRDNT